MRFLAVRGNPNRNAGETPHGGARDIGRPPRHRESARKSSAARARRAARRPRRTELKMSWPRTPLGLGSQRREMTSRHAKKAESSQRIL